MVEPYGFTFYTAGETPALPGWCCWLCLLLVWDGVVRRLAGSPPADYKSALPAAPRRPWSNSNTRRASALRAVITQGFLRGLGGRNCLMAEPYGFTFYTAGETPALPGWCCWLCLLIVWDGVVRRLAGSPPADYKSALPRDHGAIATPEGQALCAQ